MKPFHEIKINQCANGVLIEVGCLKFAVGEKDLQEMMGKLLGYLQEPDKVEVFARRDHPDWFTFHTYSTDDAERILNDDKELENKAIKGHSTGDKNG